MICAADDTINIVFNFIALAIIAEFDNFVYGSMKGESIKNLIEDKRFQSEILLISHTTSKKCRPLEESSVVLDEENDEYRPMKVNFKERSCCNKVTYLLYKTYRMFFVSAYYYFFPFLAVCISTLLPLRMRGSLEHLKGECCIMYYV